MVSRSQNEIAANFSKDAFVGTSRYYSQFRPAYPESLFADLLVQAGVSAGGRLLDLGCGPGRVAIPLQSTFREVWAVDPEREMLDEGRRLAGPLSSIRWIESTAEQLIAPQQSFDLITAGESFHRFDQRLVGGKVIGWLRRRCCLALPWQATLWPGDQDWQKVARGIVERYAGMLKAADRPKGIKEFSSFEEALVAIGFHDVSNHEFQAAHDWTIESMIGFLYSTSILSIRALGHRRSDFEADFREGLARFGKDPFRESVRFGYVIGRRP